MSDVAAPLVRSTPANFDSDDYLRANPDVAEAVDRGVYLNAREHFFSSGRKEDRQQAVAVEDQPEHEARRGFWARVLPYILLSGLALLVVVVHARVYSVVGPIDELQQIDYADHLSRGELPIFPEVIGQVPLGEEACRGLDSPFVPPPCGVTPYDPSGFQEGGLSTQSFHPPLYYAVVGPISRFIAVILDHGSLVGIQRVLGGVWLAIGLCLALATGVRLGMPRWRVAAVLALVAVMPQIVFAHSTVNNDVSALCVGALALWLVVRDKGSWVFSGLLVAVGMVAGFTKLTNGLGLGVAALFVFFAPWVTARRPTPSKVSLWQRLRPGVLMVAGYLAASVVWQIVFTKTRLVAPDQVPIFNRYSPSAVNLSSIIEHVPTYTDPFFVGQRYAPLSAPAYVAPVFAQPFYMTVAFIASLVFLAAVYGSVLIYGHRGTLVAVLGGCTAATLILAGPVQYYAVYLASSAGYSNTRYGWSVVPAYALVTALAVKGKRVWVIAGLAAVLLTAFLVIAWTAPS